MTNMQVALMRTPSSDTKTYTPGRASVSRHTISACSRGWIAGLTSEAANSSRSDGRSVARASRAVITTRSSRNLR